MKNDYYSRRYLKSYRNTTIKLLIIILILIAVVIVLFSRNLKNNKAIESVQITPAPVHVISMNEVSSFMPEEQIDDVILLAKIIQAESGVDWPDWVCMAVGEVVLNRVRSEEFPNTIKEVLEQDNPIQYEPVFKSSWNTLEPEERYIKLAERLMDGERVLEDETIIFQSLYEGLGEPIVSYKDTVLNTTTYFARGN